MSVGETDLDQADAISERALEAGRSGSSKRDGRLSWYLILCKPREDIRALEHLERQGFQCYQPVRMFERLCSGRRVVSSEPLFPRYVFIRLNDIRDNWYPIRSTRGVSHLVQFNEHPLPVRDEIIDEIRTRLGCGRLREPYLKPGERVRITDGAFSQLEGIFVANDGVKRVVLLLRILQQEQKLSFPVGSVRKVG